MDSWKLTIHSDITSIPAESWNRLANSRYPFIQHQFLQALEASGSASPDNGWTPQHLVLRNGQDEIMAVMPAYLKDHSWGEYVFDWAWADAYQRNRFPYYPKLLSAIPFTPSVGPRLLINQDYDRVEIGPVFIEAVTQFCRQEQLSSWHILFPEEEMLAALDAIENRGAPLLRRSGLQYHWYNREYDSFEHFLGEMKARKRNSIRKERAKIADQGIRFRWVNGGEIGEKELIEFYTFYHATYMKRGQYGYLNQTFFEEICRAMPDQVMINFAQLDGENIAAALFFKDEKTLYGRYWGCIEEFKHLHFETCYYQGIDYCIEQGLTHFDSGAQGEHKIQRGFEPIETVSYHWIGHPAFCEAIQNFVEEERPQILRYIEEAKRYLPFKQS